MFDINHTASIAAVAVRKSMLCERMCREFWMKIDCILLLSLTLLSFFVLYVQSNFCNPFFCVLKLNENFLFHFCVHEHNSKIEINHIKTCYYVTHIPKLYLRCTAWYFKSKNVLKPSCNFGMKSEPFFCHAHSINVHQYDLLRHWREQQSCVIVQVLLPSLF